MKTVLTELDAVLDQIVFPEGFLDAYDQLECLAHGHGTETFLVRKKDDGKTYIAKCYDLGAFKVVRESAILKSLSHDALPAFIDEYRSEDFVCVVREFIDGAPLDQYMAGRCLSRAKAVALTAALCDILTYLHTRVPPIIHRDVKPQNVIIKKNGDLALIDFDIARTYADDAETDTQFIGTRTYAPPEQYGFAQTDCRADIYSLGVLLCYMLTGSADLKNARIDDKGLAAVVRRCTAFAPEQRFASAADVKKALLRAGGSARRAARVCIAAAAALALLCTGFALGRYTGFLKPVTTAVFQDPLMERAVRAQLGKTAEEPVTADDLLAIRAVYIFGTEVSDTQDAFLAGMSGWTLPRGSLTSLADVVMMPNMEELYVNYQPLSDLEPLRSMTKLRSVNLRHTYVSDLSPLVGLPALASLQLFDTNISDLSPLAGCPQLCDLDIGFTQIKRLSDIPELKGLTRLSLRGNTLESLDGILRFPRLEWLCLSGSGVEDLTPLLSLPGLKELDIDEPICQAGERLGETPFTVRCE